MSIGGGGDPLNACSFREDFVPKTDYSELLNFGVDLSSLPFSLSMPPKQKSHFGKGTINQPCTASPRSEGTCLSAGFCWNAYTESLRPSQDRVLQSGATPVTDKVLSQVR